MWLLAQDMPDSDLLQGSAQEVLAWVVLALIVLLGILCTFFVRRLWHWEAKYDKCRSDGWKSNKSWEEKYEKSHEKLLKMALRSQRAIEVVADLHYGEEEI